MQISRFTRRLAEHMRGRLAGMAPMAVYALLALTLPGASASDVQAVEQLPAYAAHVTDLAGILGVQAVNLEDKLKQFESATGHQVMVLTVPTTAGRAIDAYAVNTFQKWKLGRAGLDDGVLFVIATGDRQMRIEVGYGLEGRLTDAQSSRIIHDVVAPEFARGRYDAGVEAGVDAILLALSPTHTLAPAAGAPQDAQPRPVSQRPTDPGQKLAFVGLVLAGIALFTIGYGFMGLLLFAFFASALSILSYPAHAKPIIAALIAAWLIGRWRFIARNVREYHLANSTNHVVTWLALFCTPGSGRPLVAGERNFYKISVSFGSAGRDRSASREPGCGGKGGRSGGAGASGEW